MKDLAEVRRWCVDRAATLSVGGAVALLGIAYFVWLGEVVFPVDDAYITQRNAQYLFAGHDPTWPDATPLHGTTSLIHVASIAMLATVMPVHIAQAAIAIASAAFFAMGVAELAKTYAFDRVRIVLLVGLGGATAGVAHQLLNGLETGLALAVITWILVALRWSRAHVHRLFPALCGIAPFVRPELLALSLLLLASAGFDRFRHARERFRVDASQLAIWTLATFVPLLAVLVLVTGSPAPSTIEAKRLFFAEGCLPFRGRLDLWGPSVARAVLLLGPVTLGALLLPFVRHGWALVSFALTFLVAYLVQFPGALGHYEHRYLYVLLPLMLLGTADAAAAAGPRRQWCGLTIGAVSLVFGLASLPSSLRAHLATVQFTRVQLVGVADWLQQHAAPGSTILVHDAGYVSRVPGLHFVDIVGLKTPSSVEVHREVTWPTCGRGRPVADDVIARAAHADYFVVLEGWDRIFQLNGGLRMRGWDLTRADGDRYGASYGIFTMDPPARALR